jgi:hypothetical protein
MEAMMHTAESGRSRSSAIVRALAVAVALVLPACAKDGGCDPTDPTCTNGAQQDNALYVDAARGLDANPGTRQAPMASLQAAVQRAVPGQTVRMAGGVYPQTVALRSGITIMGGYNGATWQRDASPTFVGTGTRAVTGENVTGVTLDGLILQAADATIAGESSIALNLNNSSVVVLGGRIVAGRGANGGTGGNGVVGAAGADGAAGRLPVACLPGVTISGGAGASSAVGRAGGTGGFGSTVDGGDGARGQGPGGTGGAGGDALGGIGRNGRSGSAGAPGARGQDGRGGIEFGVAVGAGYRTADGDAGTSGQNGTGGGGGGGGAGAAFACGASGGGGGAAGRGGAGAPGGLGGGASIGALVAGGSLTLEGACRS